MFYIVIGVFLNMKLTVKQEAFCQAYIKLKGNASDAYRQSYETDKMKPASVNRKAKELMDNVKISSRVNQLRAEISERNKITVDSLLTELEENRQAALCAETVQAAAATSATMGKAKLLGLDKKVLDITSGGEKIQFNNTMTAIEAAEAYQELMKND